MKIKTHDWFAVSQRNGETTIIHAGPITDIEQGEKFCRITVGGKDIHALESDKEIMKMILEGYEFDV